MNKTELIAAVAEKASISKKESEVVINAALDTIIDSLKNQAPGKEAPDFPVRLSP